MKLDFAMLPPAQRPTWILAIDWQVSVMHHVKMPAKSDPCIR
jgi:hypothetical protein